MTRRLSKRARNRWFYSRFDTLCNEGFTPEEANLIANCRISSLPFRKLRRTRKLMVQKYVDRGETFLGAIAKTRVDVRNSGREILDWDLMRRFVY